ncbi:unnamed protein product [Symbiodinium necroappetens]|uniref:Uncharacterized protein n=1 Tax=Symbiodinium necroappetens TaxID=1628268 RepID=A0A812JQ60_9DINO|nr:unnamed protein product [Symbiodinium necroappetens]
MGVPDPPEPPLGDVAGEDQSAEVLGATPPTTRAEQLALKGKKRKNKKSKTGLTAKKKRGNKKALPSPSRRRRRLLRRKSKSSHSLSEKVIAADDAKPVEHALDVEAELKPKSTRGSKSRGPKASIKDASPADPESKVKPSKPEAAAKGKAKAKAKAKAKGAPKATAKAKAKAAAKAKAKAKAKGAPKATAKAKAKAKGGPVDKKRGRSSAGSLDLVMPKDLEGWSDMNMQVVLSAFAREWYDHKDDCMANFKLLMRDVLPPSQSHEVACLNIYWTRFSCGVTIKSTKKDFGSYHLPHKKAAPNLRLAVEFLDMMMNEKCPHTGQTYRELGVDKLLALPLITEVFESLKEDGAAVVEVTAKPAVCRKPWSHGASKTVHKTLKNSLLWHVYTEFVVTLLLLVWSYDCIGEDFHMLEFFAGRGRVSEEFRAAGTVLLLYLATSRGLTWLVEQPRTEYPLAFARKLVSLNADLARSACGQPTLPDPLPDALETFQSMSWGQESELWQFAKLSEVFFYIRGSKRLRIPEKWDCLRMLIVFVTVPAMARQGVSKHLQNGWGAGPIEVLELLVLEQEARDAAGAAEASAEDLQAAGLCVEAECGEVGGKNTLQQDAYMAVEVNTEDEHAVGLQEADDRLQARLTGTLGVKPEKLSDQERLLIAAKARISRMVAPKTRRKELEVPEFVKNHWFGNKDEMAHLLLNLNFDKAKFINQLEVIISKKQKYTMTVDEGWYTNDEMINELKWSQKRALAAVKYCESVPDTHVRLNVYDSEKEYWVTLREKGTRKEQISHEEKHRSLQAVEEKLEDDKFKRTEEALKKLNDSILQKVKKTKSLAKELKTGYDVNNADDINCMDELHDKGNELHISSSLQGGWSEAAPKSVAAKKVAKKKLGKRSRQWSRILSHHMEQWKDSDSSLSMLIECLEYQCGQSFATGRTMGSKQWTRASGVSEFSYFLAQHIAWGCSQFHMFLAQTIQKDAGIMYIQLNCPWMGDANLAPLADSDDELLDLLTCHRSVLLAAT